MAKPMKTVLKSASEPVALEGVLVMQFEAVSQLRPEDQAIVKDVLECLMMKYQARRWEAMRAAASAPAPKATGKSSAKRAAHASR